MKIFFFRSSNTLFATRHKRSRLHGNTGSVTMDTIEVPLRRSKREKRLIFSNLNQQEIYHHMINGPPYPVMDFSEVFIGHFLLLAKLRIVTKNRIV